MNSDANRCNIPSSDATAKLPNIITEPFMDNFVYIGGGGATLGFK